MRTSILSVLGLAALGTKAQRHHYHQHAHLNARDYAATVVETVTDYVTEYVYQDGSPVPPTSTSTSSTSTTTLEAVFIQVSTSSSSTSTTTSAASSSAVSHEEALGINLAPSAGSAPVITIPSPINTPVAPAPTAPAIVSAPPPAEAPVPGERTFTILNMHTAAISTAHDDTEGTPTSAGAPIVPGTIAPGASATFAVQPGWIGNIAINDASFPITTESTLIEANFVDWFGSPRADFDISFVNGFTLPATCSCGGAVTTGCNLDLNALMACPAGLDNNSCVNPLRSDEAATAASSFFAPCEGAAWTFVNDGNADSNCVSGSIVCCVGSACPANPKQGSA